MLRDADDIKPSRIGNNTYLFYPPLPPLLSGFFQPTSELSIYLIELKLFIDEVMFIKIVK